MNITIKKSINMLTIGIMSVLLLFTSFATVAEADSNVASWIMCLTEEGSLMYNAATTDLIPYTLRSKSALATTTPVDDYALNGLLEFTGFDFTKVNEEILGRKITPIDIEEGTPGDSNNTAGKYNAFDRFGVAGLTWSSYMGEWKYYQVDACRSSEEASKTNFGSFYEHRKEPKSTYSEAGRSSDPRTMQFSKIAIGTWAISFNDTLSNIIFSITKAIISLTIVFVGLAFTDVTALIGLSPDGVGNTSTVGIFNSLFSGVFTSLVLIAVLITAAYFIYYGLFKRQYRRALNIAGKGTLAFIIAYMMSVNPAFWIGLPNKVTMYGQSIVLSAMGNATTTGELCDTEVGFTAPKGGESSQAELDKVSENMQSVISCRIWEEMLFKPWVRGQFGVEYGELDSSKIGNVNGEWVGDASVPIGDGKYINNWALFQLSSQTNAHSALGETNVPVYVSGVSNDWWRIVDAFSNYDEEQVTEEIVGSGSEITHMKQVNNTPTKYWTTWIGNNSSQRVGTAMLSVLYGIVGSIPLLIFAGLSAIYGLMLTFLMMMAPIFLLFGVAGERGNKILMGWLELLLNTMIKRVATAGLLVISFAIISAAMDLITVVGWVKSFVLLCVITLVLVKNKDTLLNMMANIDLGGIFNPADGARKVMSDYKRRGRKAGLIAVGSVAGAHAGIKTKQGAIEGFKQGFKQQSFNTMRQTDIGRRALIEYNTTHDEENNADLRTCIVCGLQLDDPSSGNISVGAFTDEYGNMYCQMCADESGIDDLYEVTLDNTDDKKSYISAKFDDSTIEEVDALIKKYGSAEKALEELKKKDKKKGEALDEKTKIARMSKKKQLNTYGSRSILATKNRSWLSWSEQQSQMGLELGENPGEYTIDEQGTQNMITTNLQRLKEDELVYKEHFKTYGRLSMPPALPEPIRELLDLGLINEAWSSERYDYIEHAYKTAWIKWYNDNASNAENITKESIDNFNKVIKDYDANDNIESKEEIIRKYSPSLPEAQHKKGK